MFCECGIDSFLKVSTTFLSIFSISILQGIDTTNASIEARYLPTFSSNKIIKIGSFVLFFENDHYEETIVAPPRGRECPTVRACMSVDECMCEYIGWGLGLSHRRWCP